MDASLEDMKGRVKAKLDSAQRQRDVARARAVNARKAERVAADQVKTLMLEVTAAQAERDHAIKRADTAEARAAANAQQLARAEEELAATQAELAEGVKVASETVGRLDDALERAQAGSSRTPAPPSPPLIHSSVIVAWAAQSRLSARGHASPSRGRMTCGAR